MPEVGGDDAVVLEDDGAFGAGNLDATRIAGVGGGGDVQDAQRTAGEFEDGDSGIFGFDGVEFRGDARLDADNIAEKPEKEIDGMDALMDQSSATIEREPAPPTR